MWVNKKDLEKLRREILISAGLMTRGVEQDLKKAFADTLKECDVCGCVLYARKSLRVPVLKECWAGHLVEYIYYCKIHAPGENKK